MSRSKLHGEIKNLSRDPGAARDITGRKKAEQSIQAASQYSRNLNKMPCPMLMTNRDGSIEEINSCFLDLAGHDKSFWLGRSMDDLLPVPSRMFLQTHLWPMLYQHGQIEEVKFEIVDKNGVRIPVLVNCKYAEHDGVESYCWVLFISRERSKFEAELIDARNRSEDGIRLIAEREQALIAVSRQLQTAQDAARDITERRKAERATQAALQYARSLLEASLDPLVTISAEGKITDVNTATEQVTGVSREKLIGSDFADYFTDSMMAREGYLQVFSQGSVTDYPLAIRHLSGKITDVLYNASLYRDGNGIVLGVFAAARDITAHKKAEAIVRDSVRRFTTALANSQLSVWEQDLQLRYTWFYNPKLGYGLEDIIGKTDAELMAPAYAKELEVLKRRVIETEQSVRQEVATAAPNSRVEFYDLSIEPLRDASGHVVGITCTAAEVTERRQAEKLTQAASKYTRSLLEASLDPLVTISAEGKITDLNTATEQVTGVSRENLIGSDFADYFTDSKMAREGYLQVFSQGSVTDYPLAIRHVTGKVTDVLYNASLYRDVNGSVLGVFAAARDITESKRLGQALRSRNMELETATAVAEEANLAKSNFLSSMSHELRTPLNAILGFAQLIESDVSSPTPSQKRSLDQILSAGWYLLELINEILDLAQIESGKAVMMREAVPLEHIMSECLELVEPLAQKRGIEICLSDGTPHQCLARL